MSSEARLWLLVAVAYYGGSAVWNPSWDLLVFGGLFGVLAFVTVRQRRRVRRHRATLRENTMDSDGLRLDRGN